MECPETEFNDETQTFMFVSQLDYYQLQRLGSTFGFSKAVDVPITTTLNVSAILSEIQDGNLMDLLCGCNQTDITISIHDPEQYINLI